VGEGQELVLMYDANLELKLMGLMREIQGSKAKISALEHGTAKTLSGAEVAKNDGDLQQERAILKAKEDEKAALMKRTSSQEGRPGYFWIKAPSLPPGAESGGSQWTVLNADFRENLIGRYVKPSDPLLRLGDKEGDWEVELKIPQKHIGQ